MGRITAIKKQKKSGSRMALHVDGEFRLVCDARFITRFDLKVGDVIDAETLAQLRHEDELAAATADAVKMLGRRARSRRDITERLQKKDKYAEEIIAETMEWLESKGFIDDSEYASDRISFLTGTRPMGRNGLVAKLIAEGIEARLAREKVDEAISPEQEQHWAQQLASRKAASMAGKDAMAIKRSIAGLLNRRGFEAELVWDVIENLDMYYDD